MHCFTSCDIVILQPHTAKLEFAVSAHILPSELLTKKLAKIGTLLEYILSTLILSLKGSNHSCPILHTNEVIPKAQNGPEKKRKVPCSLQWWIHPGAD